MDEDKSYFLSILTHIFDTTEYYLSFPLFLIKASEQFYVNILCDGTGLCGYPAGPISHSASYFIYMSFAVSIDLASVFYRGICKVVGQCETSGSALFRLLQPIGMVFSFLSVPILFTLVKNDGTAFTLQLLQVVANFLQTFFASDWVVILISYLHFCLYEQEPPYEFMAIMMYTTQSLYNYIFFLSFCLLVDRFLSVWKPLKYKYYATKKKAVFISFILFILSFILNVDYFLYFFYLTPRFYNLNRNVMIFRGLLVYTMFIMEIILCVCFVVLFVKQSNSVSSQMKSQQNNVNFILIGSVVIDSVAICTYGLFELSFGISNLLNSSAPENFIDLLLYTKIITAVAPTISVIICVIFSSMYRSAFMQTYCFLCFKKIEPKPNIINIIVSKKSNQVGAINGGSSLQTRRPPEGQ